MLLMILGGLVGAGILYMVSKKVTLSQVNAEVAKVEAAGKSDVSAVIADVKAAIKRL